MKKIKGVTFAEMFRKMREERKKTQTDFSSYLGLTSPQMISNLERGKSLLGKSDLKKLCKKFNMSYELLSRLIVQEKMVKYKKFWLGY